VPRSGRAALDAGLDERLQLLARGGLLGDLGGQRARDHHHAVESPKITSPGGP
jgi:hypothetical protein